jgi:2-polyprenyl-3-methyl-5-hydroxy-6-metoxy-1,4-benzoquinol methylase
MTIAMDLDLDLYQCPKCQGALASLDVAAIGCASCGTSVAVVDGVVDFVSGQARSTLDDIDYDEYYRIDDGYSDTLVRNIKAYSGARWPAKLGVTLEVGCGTGGFSRALLGVEAPERLVLSDVSTKMLRICRGHLDRLGLRADRRVSFATYSAVERCFRSEAFDACVGTSVVHHVADVRGFMLDLWRLLKPGGRAFFLEPNRRFHDALLATLADIVAAYLRQGVDLTDQDLHRIVNWMGEVRCNMLHADDLEYLATREDKHLFRVEDIEAFGRQAGFEVSEALNCGPDPSGKYTASVYLGQSGVGPGRLDEILNLMPAYQDRYFSLLNPQDTSPSYIVYFAKPAEGSAVPPMMAPAPGAGTPTPPTREQLMLRHHIGLTASKAASGGLSIAVDGWCVAGVGIRSIRLRAGDEFRQLPVMHPRLDVQVVVNGNGSYPPLNALCSGVRDTVEFPQRNDIELAIEAVLADGATWPLAQAKKLRDGQQLVVAT